MTYCTDADLVKYRSTILDLGVTDWAEQRQEAYEMINRVIRARWYRVASREMGYDYRLTAFNPSLVMNDCLKRLECFKTLELAYMILKKDGPEADGYERAEKSFRNRYNEELEVILSAGVDYDWDGDGVQNDDEATVRVTRRLVRA